MVMVLGTLIAASRGVPAVEHIGVLFQIGRVFRRKIVAAQRCFVLYTAALTGHIVVVVVELQVVAVAGVVEVVVLLHLHASVFRKIRIGISLREAGNRMKFLSVSQTDTATVIEVDHLVLFIVSAIISGIARCSVYRFHVVVNLCARFSALFRKCNIFSRHGINAAEIALLV